jgi:cytochrome c peroxidase
MAAADQESVNRIFSNFGKAIEAYERLIVSRNAPFDRYVAGEYGALSKSAKNGLKIFIGKAACVECHSGPLFSDNGYRNIGLPDSDDPQDTGHHRGIPSLLESPFNSDGVFSDDRSTNKLDGLEQTDAEVGRFRTRTLRNIAETAPFMHSGTYATLMDVIDFYDQGGGEEGQFVGVKDPVLVPLNLSAQEKADLVAFLETLTGEPVPSELSVDIR